MSYGLRCWDENGNVTLDITDRLSKYLGNATLTFTLPAEVLINKVYQMTLQLPASYAGSNLSIWLLPTDSVSYDGVYAIMNKYELTSQVEDTQLIVKMTVTATIYEAKTISINFNYGVY